MIGSHPSLPSARLVRTALAALLCVSLAACASVPQARPTARQPARPPSGSVISPPPRPAPAPAPPRAPDFVAPRTLKAPGLDEVIGKDASGLQRLFGAPDLDVREGDARKLQFRGKPCVLDVYLYPFAQGEQPRAAYVDARRASDGRDVNRGSCVAALRR